MLDRVQQGEDIERSATYLKLINEDLPRTHIPIKQFANDQPLNQSLRNVLRAASILRRDLGYVQGMSFLCGTLVLHMTED